MITVKRNKKKNYIKGVFHEQKERDLRGHLRIF